MLLLTDQDVRKLLEMPSCIAAVEGAFRAHGEGAAFALDRRHVGLNEGAFHLVSGGYRQAGVVSYSVKLTSVFTLPTKSGASRASGLVVLYNAGDGSLLAVLASGTLTRMRTAAVTAVAARYLAQLQPARVLLVGAGAQAQLQVEALRCVLPVQSAVVWSPDANLGANLVESLRATGIASHTATDLHQAGPAANIIVTVTPSRRPLLFVDDVGPGTFIAALGADAPEKQEIDAALVSRSRLVVDVVEQCATAGELHHALASGAMRPSDVYSELGTIVAGKRPGRTNDGEIFLFDSTGTALQDAAVAGLAWERASDAGVGTEIDLAR